MALIQTEASHLLRDTSNMAVISNNVKAYEIFKRNKEKQIQRDSELSDLRSQLEEMKTLLNKVLNKEEG
jgi:hypothetical protein